MKRPIRPRSMAAMAFLALFAIVIASPGVVGAYVLLGGSLGIGTSGNGYQRDFRIWNNSPDAASNANQVPDPAYPGALGAVMASWKAARNWGSDNPLAARNFDFDFQGQATATGSTNGNVVSWGDTGCSGGVLAYVETPISDGWRMTLCSTNWVWDGNPGVPTAGFDIQGVVTHEFGHALGLGHSAAGCGGAAQATMCPAIFGSGVEQRSIEADDQAGLEAVYGTVPAGKPVITSLTGSFVAGGSLVVHGSGFAPTVNVKFTAGGSQNTGSITGTVYNVASSAGGTQVAVTIPAAAQLGNVIVWEPSLNVMSNAFPMNPPPPPTLSSVSPASVQAYQGGTITLTGSGFSTASQVNVGSVVVPAGSFTIVGNTTITLAAPTALALGTTPVTVTTLSGTSGPVAFDYVETFPAKLSAPSGTLSHHVMTWTFAGGATDAVYLIAATDATTNAFGTPYQWLVSYILVTATTNDPVGMGSYGYLIPPGLSGITFYSQVASVDEVSGAFSGSNVTTTLIIL